MRVIAGTAGGMRLDAPSGQDVRPIPDMVRQALFNILSEQVPGARFLDLFAGAGTVGIEALSRGAAHCAFVEKSPRHAEFIRKNLEHTRLAERADLILRDAFRAPDALRQRGAPFNVIFLGPPFPLWQGPRAKAQLLALMDSLAEAGLLDREGLLIAQHDIKDVLPEETPHLCRADRRAYGRNVLSFYRRLARDG
jgi:16S rRNA (guanine966-N2)-methyltransferase